MAKLSSNLLTSAWNHLLLVPSIIWRLPLAALMVAMWYDWKDTRPEFLEQAIQSNDDLTLFFWAFIVAFLFLPLLRRLVE